MATIDATQGLQLDTVACFMRRLKDLGVTQDHLVNALDNPGITRATAEALTEVPKLPKHLVAQACSKLIDYLLPTKFDDEGKCTVGYYDDALYADERTWLSQPAQIEQLLRELTSRQLQVVVMRSGLRENLVMTAEQVGEQLMIGVGRVNKTRGEANRIMKHKALELVQSCRSRQTFDS